MPALALASLVLGLQSRAAPTFDTVTASTVTAHLRFVSSDLLEGRDTPSRGLDIAAEYIATQFQLAGLKTAAEAGGTGTDGYFQATEYENRRTQLKAPVKNVIGVLPGSDPRLSGTFVFVTAHYDHLGKREGEGDQTYNGANDDGSGVVGVIEAARALAPLKPKRTIVFMCLWGEEKGLKGSSYYVAHPVFPLKDTVVDINLEQIGRTDDTEGPRVGEFNVTGFDFTSLPAVLEKAAGPYGVKVTMHPKLSTPYFFASDNVAFANVGVPANTVSTSYMFADYHAVGDEWPKIDAANMAKVVRAVAAGVLAVADQPEAVTWNEANQQTKRFVEAWKKLHGSS